MAQFVQRVGAGRPGDSFDIRYRRGGETRRRG